MLLRRTFKPDRRRNQRQFFNTSVRVFTRSGSMDALGINISDVGMCLFTIANLPIGSEIDVEYLPLHRKDVTRITAIVRHRALYLYGIEFHLDSRQTSTGRPALETEAPVLSTR